MKFAQELVVDNAKILFGSPPIYVSSAARLFEHFSLDPSKPALLALKDHDSDIPLMVHKFEGGTAVEQKDNLKQWVSVSLILFFPSNLYSLIA